MKTIETIFDRMDLWRHFPSYQLERRADLYFALYLPEVLNRYLRIPIQPQVIPEFPVRIGLLKKMKPGLIKKKVSSNEISYKIDYVALSEDGQTAILVELKTEMRSKRDEQDKYLMAASDLPFSMMIEGINKIFRATTLKRKYYRLLAYLENLGQVNIPQQMKEIIARPTLQGITEASKKIDETSEVTKTLIVYVQPKTKAEEESPGTIITFEQFRTVVTEYADPLSQRFARSLKEWADIPAGGSG